MRIVLASASPRRRELLEQIGITFEVQVSEVEEKISTDVPCYLVQSLSRQKAEAVFGGLAGLAEEVLVIGADTVVSCDGRILGKPKSGEQAEEMLRLLQGRSHEVYTGVTLLHRSAGETADASSIQGKSFYECTKVRFFPMSGEEIREYVATGDSLDKAGAYGIQGFCARYISGIEGDYNNVVGLPVGRLYQEMREWL